MTAMGSPAERDVEEALARAVLRPRPYSEQEVEAAERRLAARLADRLLHGALSLDDEIRDGIRHHGEAAPERPGDPAGDAAREEHRPRLATAAGWRAESERHMRMLCRTVVEREGAIDHMAAFLGRRVPHPVGARVLGCVLQLAGREDGARFWWQFAAGAGDAAAAYCLYLHHLALGEAWEAELWHRQAVPGEAACDDPDAEGEGEGAGAGDDGAGEAGYHCGPGVVLRVLTLLRGTGGDDLTDRAAAVLRYVPEAVHYVDEFELPLPDADFAERIEELTA